VCFPAAAQTSLNRGTLRVYQDINRNPNQYTDNQTIQTIVIDRTARTLPDEAFVGTSVRNITFEEPAAIAVIPAGAFSDSYSLTSIHLPSSLRTIEASAFGSCTSLQRITLPLGLETIQDTAFWNTRISRLYVPDTVTYIGAGILHNIMSLESIRLPEGADVDISNEFSGVYSQNEQKAGVYMKIDNTWIYRPDMAENDFNAAR
jgi:hypothetical protein